MIEVLVVDDHPMIRNGVKAALSHETDIQVIGEAGNGLEAEQLALKLKPDVIVMDVYMPDRNGLETMLAIKRRLPEVKIMFLTVSERDEDLLKAIRMGAEGYLLKKSDAGEIAAGVRKIYAGESILSPSVTTTVLKELRGGKSKPALSAREQEVLELVAQGLTNAEISDRLFVAEGTVSTYVYRLLQKLNLKKRSEAINYVYRQNAHG